jgi:hypothetical protein
MSKNLVQNLGGYPGCYQKMQVRAEVVSPGANDSYNDIDICGPFKLWWQFNAIPLPSVSITNTISTPQNPTEFATMTVTASIPAQFREASSQVVYNWDIRSKATSETQWPEIWTPLSFTSASGTFTLQVLLNEGAVEVRVRPRIIPSLSSLQCISSPQTSITEGLESIFLAQKNDNLTLNSPSTLPNTKNQQLSNIPSTKSIDIQIAPNPADTFITINYQLANGGICSIELVDALQRTVAYPVPTQNRESGSYITIMPITNLPNGHYSLRVVVIEAGNTIVREIKSLIIHH